MRSTLFVIYTFCLFQVSVAEVPSYNISCDQNEFDNMISNWEDEIEISCTVERSDTLYQNVKIRLRGDSSLGYPKKSFRITFSITQPLNGRQKWNFNAEYLDHSYMHSYLFALIMDRLDYPCFNVDYGRIYVNGEYRGLYIRAEPYDSQFLIENSLDPQGNFYKASKDGSCLSAYDNVEEVWTKETNTSAGWNDLYQLIEDLDTLSSDNYLEFAAERFDLNDLLTIIAVNWLTANYSTYYHNYFLYHDVWNTGLWTMLPWDVDKTFDSYIYGLYTRGAHRNWPDNPLFDKLILNDYLLELAFHRLDEICEQVFNPDILFPIIDSLVVELEQAVSEDTYDDIADLEEFYEAIESLKYLPIENRPSSLHGQYDDCPRPFTTTSNQTCASPDLFASWNHAWDPNGDPVTYTLRVRRFTKIGYPDSTMVEYEGLTDTCLTISGLPPGDYGWDVRALSTYRNTVAFNQYMPFTVVYDYTELSGTLSGFTLLTSENSPYVISGDILIPSGSTVSIEPGVMLRFDEGCSMICQGNLYVEGSSIDSVVFCANMENNPWGGIALLEPDSGVNNFRFLSISGGTVASWQGNDYHSVFYASNADILIENSRFFSNEDCLYLERCSVVIRDSDFTGYNRGELFILKYGKNALIEDTAFGNMFDTGSSHDDGVEFYNCEEGDFIIRRCTIYNIDGDGIDSNNSIFNAEDNLVYNCTDKGFSLGSGPESGVPTSAVIERNIVYNCLTGIAVKDGSFADIDRCTVTECQNGIYLYEKTAGQGGGFAELSNSILYDCSEPVRLEDDSEISVQYSFLDDEWPGTGNITGDPCFMDKNNHIFFLMYNSPCIDAGDPDDPDPDDTPADMGRYYFQQGLEHLCINEIMASNDTTVMDNYAEFDDWFEIYNENDFECDLSWVYLSDDPLVQNMWQFPPGTVIPAKNFLLVWADGDYWQNGFHLPFRLRAEGDSLYLFTTSKQGMDLTGRPVQGNSGLNIVLLDRILFGGQTPDVSYGRLPDGGEWTILSFASPGFSNGSVGIPPNPLVLSYVFPNPCFSGTAAVDLWIEGGETAVKVFDISGRLVRNVFEGDLSNGQHRIFWNLCAEDGNNVPSGVYFLRVQHAGSLSEARKFIVIR